MSRFGTTRRRALGHAGRLFVALLLCGAAAEAHEAPKGNALFFDDAGNVYVRTNRGFVLGDASFGNLRLLCNEAYGANTAEIPAAVVMPSGDAFVSTARGLKHGTDGLCVWESTSLDGSDTSALMAGLVADPSDAQSLLTLRTTDGVHSDLFSSANGGADFSLVGSRLSDVFYLELAIAPSDPQRIYSSGVRTGMTNVHFVASSDDRGVSWAEHAVTVNAFEGSVRVLSVSPTDPDRVYAQTRALSIADPERLLVSVDGGATFSESLTGVELGALAVGADGQTVWAGTVDGVFRSDDSGESFSQLTDSITNVSCLLERGPELYVCARFGLDNGVGVSDDAGATFRKVLDFTDVTAPLSCSGTETESVCEPWWDDWYRELLAPPSSLDGGTLDGGPRVVLPPSAWDGAPVNPEPPPSSSDDGGCGCRAVGTSQSGALGPAWLVVAAVVFARRRRGGLRSGPNRSANTVRLVDVAHATRTELPEVVVPPARDPPALVYREGVETPDTDRDHGARKVGVAEDRCALGVVHPHR